MGIQHTSNPLVSLDMFGDHDLSPSTHDSSPSSPLLEIMDAFQKWQITVREKFRSRALNVGIASKFFLTISTVEG
jgi:hypothetical protein